MGRVLSGFPLGLRSHFARRGASVAASGSMNADSKQMKENSQNGASFNRIHRLIGGRRWNKMSPCSLQWFRKQPVVSP